MHGVRMTTQIDAGILCRMTPVDSVGYATTWSHGTFNANGADIHTPHKIPRGTESARASIDPAMLRPCAAEETLLRRIRFVNLDPCGQLIVEQGNELAIAGRRNGLRSFSPHLLCGIVERRAHIGFGMRKSVCHFPCRFVAQITHRVLRVTQHPIFAPLQPPMPTRALGFMRLLRHDYRQAFVAELDGRFDLTTTDQQRLLSVGPRKNRIHTQVYAKHWPLRPRCICDLTDDVNASIVEAYFHQTSREHHMFWQANTKSPGNPTRQTERCIADLRPLIREDHLPIARLFMRILVRLPVFAQRLCCGNGFAEIRDRLLHRLRMQGRKLPFALLLQRSLGRLLLPLVSRSSMPLDKPGPQAPGLQTCCRIGLPLLPRFREPVYFYCAITHAVSIGH